MRVLVVEDDARIAADVCKALRAVGFVVETVTDGDEAWFRGDTEDYDAIVLDLGLPHMDGLTVLKKWREAKRSVPVIALTARGSWMERVEGIDAGAMTICRSRSAWRSSSHGFARSYDVPVARRLLCWSPGIFALTRGRCG